MRKKHWWLKPDVPNFHQPGCRPKKKEPGPLDGATVLDGWDSWDHRWLQPVWFKQLGLSVVYGSSDQVWSEQMMLKFSLGGLG